MGLVARDQGGLRVSVHLDGHGLRALHHDVRAVEALDVRAPDLVALAVQERKEHRARELGHAVDLYHYDVERAVVHAAVRHDLHVPLDHGGVCHQAHDALALVGLAVHGDAEAHDIRAQVGKGRGVVGRLAHERLVGKGRLHELGVVSRAAHEGKAALVGGAVNVNPAERAQVEVGHLAHAAGARERLRLGRVSQVGVEEVGRPGGEGAHRNPRARKRVHDAAHRAVST